MTESRIKGEEMKKKLIISTLVATPILAPVLFLLFLFRDSEIFFPELRAEMVINKYYKALIEEDYEKAFQYVYTYDEHYTDGINLSRREAKELYLQKTEWLQEQNYRVKDFEIKEVEYEDGHSFWHHITLEIEKDGQTFERAEVADIYKRKVVIGGRGDVYSAYRDGNLDDEYLKIIE